MKNDAPNVIKGGKHNQNPPRATTQVSRGARTAPEIQAALMIKDLGPRATELERPATERSAHCSCPDNP